MIVGAECSATNVNGRGPVSKEDSTAISNAMAKCPKSLSETRTSPNSASFSFLALLQLQSQSAERTAASSEQGHPVPIQKAAPNGSGRMNPLPPSTGCQARNDYGIDIWSMVDLYRACHWVHMSPHECKSYIYIYICHVLASWRYTSRRVPQVPRSAPARPCPRAVSHTPALRLGHVTTLRNRTGQCGKKKCSALSTSELSRLPQRAIGTLWNSLAFS